MHTQQNVEINVSLCVIYTEKYIWLTLSLIQFQLVAFIIYGMVYVLFLCFAWIPCYFFLLAFFVKSVLGKREFLEKLRLLFLKVLLVLFSNFAGHSDVRKQLKTSVENITVVLAIDSIPNSFMLLVFNFVSCFRRNANQIYDRWCFIKRNGNGKLIRYFQESLLENAGT